jgi:N-acetylglucosamine-6-phosphate deacetylase
MSKALVNARVFTGERLLEDHAVILDRGRIAAICPVRDVPQNAAQRRDLGGGTLVPGFIDLQVNGGGGLLFNDAPTVRTIARIGAAHRGFGTTAFLPTLISDEPSVMAAAIEAVREAITAGVPGVLGIHLEGPYLNAQRKGVHREAVFSELDEEAEKLVSTFCGGKTLLTLAPERNSPGAMARLASAGVILASGHTAATYEQTRSALASGITGFTHLFNAMTPMSSREPGVVGAALEDENSWCGVIVDGHHVHPASLRVALAAKPPGKVFLVTDAMPSVGASEKTFQLNGETISVEQGRCTTQEGVLAGSDLDMLGAVRNCVDLLGLDWREAVRMASAYPAAFIGVDDQLGYIRPGYRASMLLLDENLELLDSWIDGANGPALNGTFPPQ